ncbi:serine/threonine protein kinase [Calothrix sp. 336/3]|nr:serine/threonine protein kinase [Calothrix sp. 336/3]
MRTPSNPKTPPQDNTGKGWLRTLIVTSLSVSTLIIGIRQMQWLQSWELSVYDQMLRLMPPEVPDSRILLVTVTEADLAANNQSLSDEKINQLLIKLQSYQPRVIGLGIDRSLQKNFAQGLQKKDNIIATCTFSSMESPEIPPPRNIPIEQVGYTDLLPDNDGILRRSLLFATSDKDKQCTTQLSFAALLAMSYLQKENIEANFVSPHHLQMVKSPQKAVKNNLYALDANSGSYQNINAEGYQILINYRNPANFTQQVTLTQVLKGEIDPNSVKDRLVIIGSTIRSIHPGLYTPYTGDSQHSLRMQPVYIHTQIASQLISAVLDGRPLMGYWADWAEALWIWGWSLVGGVLAWWLKYPLRLGVADGISVTTVIFLCYLLFLRAVWIPVVPPILSLVLTGLSIMAYNAYRTQQQTQIVFLEVEKQRQAIDELNSLLKDTRIVDKHFHSESAIYNPEKATGDFILSGRYQITQVLGSGGFGCTYLAQDTQRPGNPTCVVKQLMPARRDARFLEVARRLFDAEAEILETLGKHSHIPELLAYFEENNEFYLVQEYIQGHSLGDELPPFQQILDEKATVEILKGVLEILVFVHEHRVIHRDIKPSNIMRQNSDRRLVLIDFGAVKTMQPVTEKTELATIAIGTRGYAPPEQFAGHPRLYSDIYALGMIGVQAVTGIPPHELSPNPQTGNVEWQKWTKINADLAGILDKMVRYHFSDRYQSAHEVLQDLKKIGY